MAIAIQYNKTFLQQLASGLKVRENALPTLMAKEAALRVEVKRARDEVARLSTELAVLADGLDSMARLWTEFPHDLLRIGKVTLLPRKIAGVTVSDLDTLSFVVRPFADALAPAWLRSGIDMLKRVTELRVRSAIARQRVTVLEYARRKTTQKVNLYEKVQIPQLHDAIRRIKRFLEDDENLAKAAQKILKARIAAEEAGP